MNFLSIVGLASLFGIVSAAVFVTVSVLFLVAVRIKNNSILDIYWGLGFVLCVVIAVFLTGNLTPPSLTVTLFVTIWGSRLAYHIFLRNRGRYEDTRYAAFREKWKNNFLLKSYVNLFLLQGFLLLIISLTPIAVIFYRKESFELIDKVGIFFWLIGFYFETVGDWQLSQFKKNPANKGKVMTQGLWQYTRHPNYFGESMMWWAIWLFSLSTPVGLITIISPILITVMLLKVSGVTMLEDHYKGNSDYDKYKKRTNAFIPWFPQSNSML